MTRAPWLIIALSLTMLARPAEAQQTYRSDHAAVSYSGISEKHAKAIADVVEAARAAAVEQYGFDMPDTVTISVECDPKKRVRLFNDGNDHMFLTLRTERDLLRPKYSGIFHLYGLCHEIGHLAMYRVIRQREWMSTAAAEGWAHYLGSRLVDAVYGKLGQEVWPDRYDYRADGMQRLKRQLASRPDEVAKGAGQWMKLAEIVGDKALASLFQAWAKAEIDLTDPAAALRRTLLATCKDRRLEAWWNQSERLFVVRRPKSGFAARTCKVGDLAGDPVELVCDDDKPAGKNSMAGTGHAVRFSVRGSDWYLTAVKVHGARYGYPRPPSEDFHVYLCDADFKQIADFPVPYAKFARGASQWVSISVTPTQVPPKFIVCVAFNPTATKGVYVSRDAAGGGTSLTGLPGKPAGTFSQGDWLIRATVDRPRAADALKAPR
jgi:RNA polymerase sigma-70 factor (ECF subfamily)